MNRMHLPVLTAAVLLAACQAASPPTATPASPASPADAAPASGTANETATGAATVARGQALYRERMLLPPGSRMTVKLIDNLLADTPRAVLAETTVEGLRAPPFAFELPYPADAIRDNGMYGLHASIRGPDGTLMFVTDTRVPFTPGADEAVELMLVRVGPADGGASAASPATSETPPPADDSTASDADADADTDTDTAGDTGFRAIGNEPGWSVEVGTGEAPRLVAELDYGERRVVVSRAQPQGLGFVGTAEDGAAVRLEIERVPCQDDMSGEPFAAKATLTVNDARYRGCGAFLDP